VIGRRHLAAAAAVVALAGIVLLVPFVGRDRDVIAASPSPPPLFEVTPTAFVPGSRACIDDVTFSPSTQVALLRVATFGRPGPRLRVIAEGPGYRSTREISGYPEGVPGVPLSAPRRELLGRLCIDQLGPGHVTLGGTQEARTRSRTTTTLDGARQNVDVTLTFYEARRVALAARLPDVINHGAAYLPSPLGAWTLWLLLPLLGLVVPAGVLWALHEGSAGEAGEREAEPGELERQRAADQKRGGPGGKAAAERLGAGGVGERQQREQR
jgi:hypothetical protein